MKMTTEQQRAVNATNPEVLVSAPAGSGKTAMLVERVMRLILDGVPLQRMLIVTYTRAAAAELRGRLEAALTEAAREPSEMDGEEGAKGSASAYTPEQRAIFRRESSLVPLSQISTLHSFGQRVLRCYFQHCHIDPKFTILQDRDKTILMENAQNSAMERLYARVAGRELIPEEGTGAAFEEGGENSAEKDIGKDAAKDIEKASETNLAEEKEDEKASETKIEKETVKEDEKDGETSAGEEDLLPMYSLTDRLRDAQQLTTWFTDDQIQQMLISIFAEALDQPYPEKWLVEQITMPQIQEDFASDRLWLFLREQLSDLLSTMGAWMEEAEAIQGRPQKTDFFMEEMRRDWQGLKEGLEAGSDALIQAMEAVTFQTMQLGKIDPLEKEAKEQFQALRDQFKNCYNKEFLPLAVYAGPMAREDLRATEGVVRALALLTLDYIHAFYAAKLEDSTLDYNDLEHLTLKLLSGDYPDVQKSLSERYDAIFVDEYQDISALQDTVIQGLKRLGEMPQAQPQTFFYVGDVKQSIYRFRQARPALFLQKYRQFSEEEKEEGQDVPAFAAVLTQNFRSKSAILRGVNRTFEVLMREDVTEIAYDRRARMSRPRDENDQECHSIGDAPIQLRILSEETTGSKGKDQELNLRDIRREAQWIARDIQRKVGTPRFLDDGTVNPDHPQYCYRDIVVLMPTAKGKIGQVEEIFQRENIPVYAQNRRDSLQSEEVRLALNWLGLLTDPTRDVPLLAILRGPLFSLTSNDLAEIRLSLPTSGTPFYKAMEAAMKTAPEPLKTRLRAIDETLKKERFLLSSMPLSDYLWSFFSRSGLYAYFGTREGGEIRQANLRVLCVKAESYEETCLSGVRGFVEQLSEDNRTPSDMSPALMDPASDVVQLMTVHCSKGLQFPIVYVMGMGEKVEKQNQAGILKVNADFGIAPASVHPKKHIYHETLRQRCLRVAESRAERSEKVRLLYVAMTRAAEQLILVGGISNILSGNRKNTDLDQCLSFLSDIPNQRVSDMERRRDIDEGKTYLDWLMLCLKPQDQIREMQENPDGSLSKYIPPKEESPREFLFDPCAAPEEDPAWDVQVVYPSLAAEDAAGETPGLSAGFPWHDAADLFPWEKDEHFRPQGATGPEIQPGREPSRPEAYIRPFIPPEVTAIQRGNPVPMKMGVTALCRALSENRLPDEEDEEETPETKRYPLVGRQPRLMDSVPEAPAFLTTPAPVHAALKRGVQTHRLLSLLNLESLRQTELTHEALLRYVQGEVTRLQLSGHLRPEEAASVDVAMALRFLESPIAARMLKSGTVWREHGFTLATELPGAALSGQVLLQGVVDLCFLEGEEWVLLDYKTDWVDAVEDLLPRYRQQVKYYREALKASTGRTVREAWLFSLRLGVGIRVEEEG